MRAVREARARSLCTGRGGGSACNGGFQGWARLGGAACGLFWDRGRAPLPAPWRPAAEGVRWSGGRPCTAPGKVWGALEETGPREQAVQDLGHQQAGLIQGSCLYAPNPHFDLFGLAPASFSQNKAGKISTRG